MLGERIIEDVYEEEKEEERYGVRDPWVSEAFWCWGLFGRYENYGMRESWVYLTIRNYIMEFIAILVGHLMLDVVRHLILDVVGHLIPDVVGHGAGCGGTFDTRCGGT